MGVNHEFTQKQLQKAFSTAQSNDDTLMVKFAMLYFLESVLLGKEPKNKIDDLHIRLLDNFKEFNNYPWGRLSFEATMLSLKNTVTRRSKRIGLLDPNTEEKYSLYDFPFAFQVWTYEVISEFGLKFATEKGDLKVPRILKWFCKNKIMADVINKALKEEDTFTVVATLHATGSDGSNAIAQHHMQWFLASEIEWKQELGELNAVSGDEPNNKPNSAHSNVQMQQQVDVVVDDRHATITDDISQTPFNAPSPGFFPSPRNASTFQRTTPFHEKISKNVTPSCRVSIGDHVAPTFQKIYDRLSKIEEKPPAHDPPTSVASDVVIDKMDVQLPTHDPHISVASHVDHDKIDDQTLAHDHQTAETAHVDADKIDVEPSAHNHQSIGAAHVDADKIDVEVYIPLYPKQDHWALAQFDLQKEIIFVYDSMLDYMNDMNDSAFEKELLPNDCGVFVMFYLEALVYGLDIPYDVRTQAGIDSYRKQVAIRLFSDKKLIEECD
ncbi:hypothetical protein WN943_019778 [Citrus x changshan-huyou]